MTDQVGAFDEARNPASRRRRDTIRVDDGASGPKSLPPAPPLKDLDPLNVRGLLLENRYRVEKFVGSGGLGYVYAGVDLRFFRPGDNAATVAIKFMKHGRKMMKDFHREAQLMKQFGRSHHAFVEVYDYGVSQEGLPWLVMEFLPDAISINELMARYEDRVPRDIVVQFLREVCSALSLAHSRNLVHRDLSGSNIMLARAGDPRGRTFKILDFGLSTQLDATDDLANQTITSNPYGTPSHMAPEQVTSQGTTPQTDVYSIGVTLFQLLAGQLPLPRTDSVVEAFDHCRHTVPFTFREVAPDRKYRPEVERVVQQCLCKRPADRPQDLQQVAEQLITALTAADTRQPLPSRVRWLIAASCFIGLALIAWMAFPPTNSTPVLQPFARLPSLPPPVISVEPKVLTVPTGGTVSANVVSDHLPPEIEFTVQPDTHSGLTARFVPDSQSGEKITGELVVHAEPSAAPRDRTIQFTGRMKDNSESAGSFEVKVRIVWLPRDFTPVCATGEALPSDLNDPAASAEIVRDNDERYGFRRISRQVGDELVEFLLVPRPLSRIDLSSFYILKYKVWRGLYKEFLKTNASLSDDQNAVLQDWAREGTDRWPATGLSPLEADRVAKWLGGTLPSQAQWDRASGSEFSTARFPAGSPPGWDPAIWSQGPYRIRTAGDPQVALHHYAEVGASADDETWCGCRDMAGNGFELLDDFLGSGRRLSRASSVLGAPASTDKVFLRGRPVSSEAKAASFDFRSLETERTVSIQHRALHCGFRVVIERR